MTQRGRYLVSKGKNEGPPRYWQPSAKMRAAGFRAQRLSDHLRSAISEAEALTAEAIASGRIQRLAPNAVREAQAPRRDRQKSRPGSRFVYVISVSGGHVKIGRSDAPWKRLMDIQVGNPRPVRLHLCLCTQPMDAVTVEAKAHARLFQKRVEGEWFDCTVEQAVKAVLHSWWLRPQNDA